MKNDNIEKTTNKHETTLAEKQLDRNITRDSIETPNTKRSQSDPGKYNKEGKQTKQVKKTFLASEYENLKDNGGHLNQGNVKLHQIDPVKVYLVT